MEGPMDCQVDGGPFGGGLHQSRTLAISTNAGGDLGFLLVTPGNARGGCVGFPTSDWFCIRPHHMCLDGRHRMPCNARPGDQETGYTLPNSQFQPGVRTADSRGLSAAKVQ